MIGSGSGSARARGHLLRLGTRRSQLALSQARNVADAIVEQTGAQVGLVEIVTQGDRSSSAWPSSAALAYSYRRCGTSCAPDGSTWPCTP